MLDKRANILIKSTIIILLAIALSSFAYLIYPICLYIFYNKRPLIIPIEIPFFDIETDFGYNGHLAFQIVINLITVFGNFAIEIVSALFVQNFIGAVDVVIGSFREIGSELKVNRKLTIDLKWKLRNNYIRIQDAQRLV